MRYCSNSGMIKSEIIKCTLERVGLMSKEWDGNGITLFQYFMASTPLFQCKFTIPLLLFLSSPGKLSDMLRLCNHDSSVTVNTGTT